MARSTSADEYYGNIIDELGDDGESSLSDQIDFQHYVRILRKYKWSIFLFTSLVTGLAVYYAMTATPIYKATSTLLIESQKANIMSIEELVGLDNENKEYYLTQYALLKSRGLAERVVDRLGWWGVVDLSSVESTGDPIAVAPSTEGTSIADKIKAALVSAGILENPEQQQAAVRRVQSPDVAQDQLPKNILSADLQTDSDNAPIYSLIVDKSGKTGQMPEFKMTTGLDRGGIYRPRTEEELRRASVVANFRSSLTISPIRSTKLVELSFESTDPIRAAQAANAVGEQYIQSYLDARIEMTLSASTWLSDRLGTLKGDLDKSENRLMTFKKENGLVDVGGSVGRLNEQELLLATNELALARTGLATARDLVREVRDLKGKPEALESIVAIQGDGLVQQVKVEQGQRQRELDELLNRYGNKHPRVVDARSRLASLDATMQGHVSRAISSIEKNYQLQRQRVASIEAKLSKGKGEIQALGTKLFKLTELEREVATKRNVYDSFYSRMTEANSAEGLEAANARITDLALPPLSPSKPQKQLIIALAAIASLILSSLMALLYEQMDDTIKSTDDIENKLGMELLGILPLIKQGLLNRGVSGSLSPLDITDKKGTFTESVNSTRTTLCLDDGDKPRKVFVVTSSVPGEGKTTVSMNLAYSLAQMERVLIIDCDMRKPSIAKTSGYDKNVPGLSNLITNSASAKDCIIRGVFNGVVDILPSGPIPEQPLELLASNRFKNILEQLKDHYDRIIIDSAPTQAVSDALLLSKLSDAVLYVVKSHSTEYPLIERGIQRLKQINAPIAGVIVTQVDIDKITSYGGDYYYQGYYDYYGYSEKNAGQSRSSKIRLSANEIKELKNDNSAVELDLDFEYASDPVISRQYAKNIDRVANSEFDMTAQMDIDPSIANLGRQVRQTRTRSSKRFTDDLDII